MNNFSTYQIQKQKGIDDLLCEYAFIGNSQGDTSCSNNITDYKSAEGWMSFVFKDIDISDQIAINKESERRKQANIIYINSLKEKGEYGQCYNINIHIKPNPLFDK